jgi:hypothetical protein
MRRAAAEVEKLRAVKKELAGALEASVHDSETAKVLSITR